MLRSQDLGSSDLALTLSGWESPRPWGSASSCSRNDFAPSLGITLFICKQKSLDKMISKDLSSSKFCDYILNVRTTWHLLASPLMKLPIIYLIQRKHTPRATDQPSLKMRVCGFLSCPQLSSDASDKCVCLLKKIPAAPAVTWPAFLFWAWVQQTCSTSA